LVTFGVALYQLAPGAGILLGRARQVPQPSRATWLAVRQVTSQQGSANEGSQPRMRPKLVF